MSSQLPDERRIGARRVFRTRVKLIVGTGVLMDAKSLNISATGMAIVADGPIAVGTQVMLRCLISQGSTTSEFVAQALVVHSIFSSGEGGFVIGVAFKNLAPQMATLAAAMASSGT